MTQSDLKELIARPEYDFLRKDEHLNGRIVFLTLGGSHAYGTDTAASDVDIRGCALNSPSDLLGMTSFEHKVDRITDTTVYSFNKLISLLLSCNPNAIELLGCKPEHYIIVSEIGKELIANRKMFLSQKASSSFRKYAISQLRCLENAIARDRLPQEEREAHIMHSMTHSLESLGRDQGVELFLDDSKNEGRAKEIFANISLTHYPVRSFRILLNELDGIMKSYDHPNHRNHKKDEKHLNKHAMHLIRLFLTCIDLLEKGDIITNRENDHDLLMSIRNGAYMNPDGTYQQEFFDMVNQYEQRLNYAKQNTGLPKEPDLKQIEEFVMDVNRKSI